MFENVAPRRRARKVALALVGLLAVALTINTVVVQRETEPAAADVGRILSLPGPDLQLREDGSPDRAPLVLLHCYTCSIEWWDAITPRLARSHRVIRLDLIGHGGSEKPSSGYTMEEQADQVALALRRLEVRQAVVVGQSMGVSVATALAERHSELVRSVVAIDEAPGDDWEQPIGLTAKLGFVPVLGEAIYRLAPDSEVEGGLEIAFAEGFEVPDFALESFRDLTYNAYRDSGIESDDYKDQMPIHERLGELELPVMAMFGEGDRIADVPQSLAAYRQIPNVRTHVIDSAGHSPNVERPRRTAGLIARFARPAARNGRAE